jgi:hypothetical protein
MILSESGFSGLWDFQDLFFGLSWDFLDFKDVEDLYEVG